MLFEIKIPFKTPTVNNLYTPFRGRMILKKEAREIKKEIKEIIINQAFPLFAHEETKLKVSVEIHEDWFTKKGDVKRKDVANREKFLIDSVFEALEIDDKFIFEHNIVKIQDTNEFAIVRIEEIKWKYKKKKDLAE